MQLLILTWTSNIQMSSTSVAAVRRQPAVVTRMAAALRHKVSAAQSINLGRVHTTSRSVCRRFLCGVRTHRKVKKGCSRNHGSEGTGLTTVGEDIRIFHHVTMKILTAQNSVTILTTCHRIWKSTLLVNVYTRKSVQLIYLSSISNYIEVYLIQWSRWTHLQPASSVWNRTNSIGHGPSPCSSTVAIR